MTASPEPGGSTSFTKTAERLVHAGAVVDFFEVDFVDPDGDAFTRDVIRHPGAVAIVAIDADDNVVLVRQFRAALEADVLEIPAGKLDVAGEAPIATARRELAEEVGLTAQRWVHLTTFLTAPGFSDEVLHVFLAEELTEVGSATEGPEERHMTVERIPVAECGERIRAGEITDAKTIIGVMLALAQRP